MAGPLVAAVLVAGLAGCRTMPIQNVTAMPLSTPPNKTLTMADVSTAIQTAGTSLGWVIQEVRPGELTGTLKLRRHRAVVAITHDTSTFSITYKDSDNLLHQGDEIHRYYNGWVANLARHIQVETMRLGTAR